MQTIRKCSSCGHWTIFQIAVFCHKATTRCSHCQYTLSNQVWDREARRIVEEQRQKFELLCQRYPQLRQIKEPGDHVKLDDVEEP